jgi:predicted lactoylglutathione lyase
MIGYVTLGTNDLETAVSFYDELLASIGAKRIFEQDNFVAWSTGPANPALAVSRPYDGEPATIGNGVMIAIALDAPEKVDAFYAKVMELGGSDEGAPGPRGETFYAAYFRDLDGNKLNAFCMTSK